MQKIKQLTRKELNKEFRELTNWRERRRTGGERVIHFGQIDLEEKCHSLSSLSMEDFTIEYERKDLVNQLLSKLSPYNREIIELRFGLNGLKEHSINDIAEHKNVSSQAVHKRFTNIMSNLKSTIFN